MDVAVGFISGNVDRPTAGVAADLRCVEGGADLDSAAAGAAEGFPTGAGAMKLERGQRDYGWHGRSRCRWRRSTGSGRDRQDTAATDATDRVLFVALWN